ncbi:hypothetical protein COOONC_20406 [Cooperia oncophora]
MTLSSQLLNLVKGKYFFLRSSIDQLQMGITNLRNAPIQESDIASLEEFFRPALQHSMQDSTASELMGPLVKH